ncbi:hypothetical protein JTB14_014685 [Gonioctena quinquepunctata]|nr:hypothetical protein JTB14_014685 [Gonioctena quinquepunctata]
MKKRKAEEARVRNEMLEEKAKKIKGESAENTKTIRQPKAKPGLPYLPEPALPKPSLPEPTQPGPPLTEPSLPKPEVSKPRKRSKKAKLDMEVYVDESDADESDLATQSESDDEIVIPQGPTRSGRMPKVTKKYENELCTVENIMLRTKVPDNIKPSNVEPGSIMIISEMGANGEPNIITISENHTDDEVEAPIENNQTIPADETVTTLKSDKLMQENFPLTSEDESVCVNRNVGLQYVESDASVTDYDVASSTLDGESGENYVVMSSEN